MKSTVVYGGKTIFSIFDNYSAVSDIITKNKRIKIKRCLLIGGKIPT
jgi:hypothetical protein